VVLKKATDISSCDLYFTMNDMLRQILQGVTRIKTSANACIVATATTHPSTSTAAAFTFHNLLIYVLFSFGQAGRIPV